MNRLFVIKIFLGVVLLVLFSFDLLAFPGFPEGGGDPPCWPPPCIPVDGGITALLALGVGLGVKKTVATFKSK